MNEVPEVVRAMAQRIENWPLERLIPYARNPRTHSDVQVAQIAASIAEFGFNNPILVDSKLGIIASKERVFLVGCNEKRHLRTVSIATLLSWQVDL